MLKIVLISWGLLFFVVPARAAEVQSDSTNIETGDGGMTVSPWSREDAHERSLHRRSGAVAKCTEGKAQARATGLDARHYSAEPDVTPELVCAVKAAVRRGEPSWPAEKCDRVAAALNTTAAPRTLWGIYINESDMRDHVAVWHGPRTVDAGGFGLRCLLDDHGRCANGVVRGYRVRDLQDAETSIRLANVLLVSLGGDVQGWNRRSRGYAARIRALVAALDGLRLEVRSARTREQVRRILNVTKKGEPRS